MREGLAVAIVDVKRVFESYSKTREAQERIDEARKSVAKELQERLAAVAEATEAIRKLDEQLADPALGEVNRKARTQERSAKALELRTMEQENAEFCRSARSRCRNNTCACATASRMTSTSPSRKACLRGVSIPSSRKRDELEWTPILLRHQGVADWTEPLIARLNITKGDATRVPIEWEECHPHGEVAICGGEPTAGG
ncbi:MAG: hypothetical protein QM757_36310 [Paludibaculum sp.]